MFSLVPLSYSTGEFSRLVLGAVSLALVFREQLGEEQHIAEGGKRMKAEGLVEMSKASIIVLSITS